METVGIIYGVLINLAAFAVYGLDKWKAKRHAYRISENMLIGLAVIGGSAGAWFGMQIFRHKTKHQKFTVGIPLILLLQILLVTFRIRSFS